ncbi:MAG: FAD-binding oxidoreductase [Actinomycetota bacterium]|nr:FAD-binding oxidoreductase [Actinomycetota bacterium]
MEASRAVNQREKSRPLDAKRVGMWMDTVPGEIVARPTMPGDIDVDVLIVGAGYTGLWTAYYLNRAQPDLRIAILEKEVAGFGASGRNGGWCSALFAAGHRKIERAAGRDGVIAMQRAMFETVDEVGRVIEEEGIEADFEKAGTITLVTAPTQLARIKDEIAEQRSWGFGEDDIRWLAPREAAEYVRVPECYGATFTPHCAALHPARLARGLAEVVERRGVTIYEGTAATRIASRRVETERGVATASLVVRATEGYTASLHGMRRELVPLYSLMVATEPLPAGVWEEIGWRRRVTLSDGRHLLIYAQRTADDRIALGGRGAPYHFGSRVRPHFERRRSVFEDLRGVMHKLWPATSPYSISHEWGGPLGVPRDWYSSVGFDRVTGVAWAGGYVGDGVSTTNLAGRTLADLLSGKDTDLVRLPWVDHRSRRWEPEPLRWIGINLATRMYESADKAERRRGKPVDRRVDVLNRLIGL